MPVHNGFVVRGRIIGQRLKKRKFENQKKAEPLRGPAHKTNPLLLLRCNLIPAC
jgi:hypothetical protein